MDYTKEEIFSELEKLYEKASLFFDKGGKNFCGECYSCCTPTTIQGISQIEYDYIERIFRKEKKEFLARIFKDYIRKKRDIKGNLIYERCPLYDLQRRGCSIYSFRPFSCRFYGFYSPEPPPLFCVFHDRVVIYSVRHLYSTVPFVKSFLQLRNLYNILIAELPEEKVQNLYQMGYDLYFQGEVEKSEKYLKEALRIDPYCWRAKFQLSQLYYGRGEMEKALLQAESANIDTENNEIKLHLALLYLHCSFIEKSLVFIEKILSKEPENAVALGIMAFIFYLRGNIEGAIEYSQKALHGDRDLPIAKKVLEMLVKK